MVATIPATSRKDERTATREIEQAVTQTRGTPKD